MEREEDSPAQVPAAPLSMAPREEDGRLHATRREMQNGSDKYTSGERGMWGDVGDGTSQEEACLEVEAVERGVSAQ